MYIRTAFFESTDSFISPLETTEKTMNSYAKKGIGNILYAGTRNYLCKLLRPFMFVHMLKQPGSHLLNDCRIGEISHISDKVGYFTCEDNNTIFEIIQTANIIHGFWTDSVENCPNLSEYS